MISDRLRRNVDPAGMDLPSVMGVPQPPSVGAAAPAQAIIPVDTAYWAAAWINLDAYATVLSKQLLQYLTIVSEKLTVGDSVTFT